MKWLNRVATVLLLGLVIFLLLCIFLVEFDPQGWRSAFLITALNLATVDPLTSFLQLAFCIRAGWPLRRVGYKPPGEEFTKWPAYICFNFSCRRASDPASGDCSA